MKATLYCYDVVGDLELAVYARVAQMPADIIDALRGDSAVVASRQPI